MIFVVALYPNEPGKRFDFDYYMNRHIPMVKRFGEKNGLKEIKVARMNAALGGPNAEQPYTCAATLIFESAESLQNYLANHAQEIFGDIPNYTDIQPVIQAGELLT